MEASTIGIIVFFSLLAILGVCSLYVKRKEKIWLFVPEIDGVSFEIAVRSARNPKFRKKRKRFYSYRLLFVETTFSMSSSKATMGRLKKGNIYILYDGSIEKILGRKLNPNEPAVPVSSIRIQEYVQDTVESLRNSTRRFEQYIQFKKNQSYD